MAVIFLFLYLFGGVLAVDWDVETPLDRYVNREDPNYEYSLLETYPEEGYTLYVLNMTSQKWMNESIVEDPIWWHYLAIAIPDELVITDAAYLRIHSGDNDEDSPANSTTWNRRIGQFAVSTGAVAAILYQVPNQPTFFVANPVVRVEDMIIGYTWRVFIEEEIDDPEIILLFPMVKAAKQACDTITTFAKEQNDEINLNKFLPSGASKRGWTAWLLGCVDRRVFALAPIVLDNLNFVKNLEHHYRAYGGWSWAFLPYWSEGVSRYLYHPRAAEVGKNIDPFEFNERLTMPKLIASAVGDQFFLPDDSHYFFDDLTGPKYMMLMENTDHSHGNYQERLIANIQSFFLGVYNNFDFPQVSWMRNETESSGSITLTADRTPNLVRAWRADTTNMTEDRRDFRVATAEENNPIVWLEEAVEELGNNKYFVEYDKVEAGRWRGFFIEARFPGPEDGRELHFTSEINIIPDTFPYERCQTEDECAGDIV